MRGAPLWWDAMVVLAALAWGLLASMSASGCTVRSVTVCAQYDRALQRPDPALGYSRDAAGASACVETGPRE